MLRTALGVARSLRIYYGHPARARAMDRLYARFIAPGDLAFDVGAHVGDRIAAFRRLGARVVAVEPQPALHRTLRLLFGRDDDVAIVPSAVGRAPGTARMRINPGNPTISTLSEDFIAASRGAAGWQGEAWPRTLEVPVTTLDALVATHGRPAFVKLDIEGFEAEALRGLSRAVPALSFEFTTIQRDVALACLERCMALGYTQFNAALGESQSLGEWRSAEAIADWLNRLPQPANSGDIYAWRPVADGSG
jgi:FkbM family methyltransferase